MWATRGYKKAELHVESLVTPHCCSCFATGDDRKTFREKRIFLWAGDDSRALLPATLR